MELEAARLVAAAIVMGLGSIGAALGEGLIGSKAMEAMSRNPEISDKLMSNMLVSMAVTESTGIYSLVIALIILFVA
jgi:F-type H+-transporting ATPase subunit c